MREMALSVPNLNNNSSNNKATNKQENNNTKASWIFRMHLLQRRQEI